MKKTIKIRIFLLPISSLLLLSCKARQTFQESVIRNLPIENELTLSEYIASCEKELGKLPLEINCSEENTNTIKFTDLENSESISESSESLKDGEEIQNKTFDKCKNPSFGSFKSEACIGSAKLYEETNNAGTKSVAVCRKLSRNGKLNYLTALISHNPKSGATCFFLYQKKSPYVELGKLPGPSYSGNDSSKLPEKNWRTPAYMTADALGTCVECHSASPWIRNPSVALESKKQIDAVEKYRWLVPSGARMNKKETPYWVVERKRLSQLPVKTKYGFEQAGNRWMPTVLDTNIHKNFYCLGCHTLGAGPNLKLYAPAMAGFLVPSSDVLWKDLLPSQIRRSKTSLHWPDRAWHSSVLDGKIPRSHDNEEEFQQKTRPSIELFLKCSKNPELCSWRNLGEP